MKTSTMKRKNLIAATIIMILSNQVFAETAASSPEPLELLRIMQDLGVNMQTITDGISREEWGLVEKAALQIADHPKPPISERARIMGFIGMDAGKFKGNDGETHEAAIKLKKSASDKDGSAVIADFATLQNTCLKCHQSFRKPFREHFYGDSQPVTQ